MTTNSWNFMYQAPTKIDFGWGKLDKLADHLTDHDRILVICGKRSAQESGLLDRMLGLLGDKQVSVFDKISPNPRVSEVNEAAELGRQNAVTIVIGMGGGSVMDGAKATAAAIGGAMPIEHYLRQDLEAPASTLPILAIPTTAGTGSETSMGAIISDEVETVKKGLRGRALLPQIAIVDPELTMTVPLLVTAETGFDIFTHAVETFISTKASEMTAIYSVKAIEVVLDYLPRVLENLQDKEARTQLAFASMLMGYNLMHAGTCLPHRLQYPLGAHTNCSHPAGLAALYPSWCKETAPFAMDKFDKIAEIFESRGYRCDESKGADAVHAYVSEMLKKLDITYKIEDFGLNYEDLNGLPQEVSGSLMADPGRKDAESLLKIYQDSW